MWFLAVLRSRREASPRQCKAMSRTNGFSFWMHGKSCNEKMKHKGLGGRRQKRYWSVTFPQSLQLLTLHIAIVFILQSLPSFSFSSVTLVSTVSSVTLASTVSTVSSVSPVDGQGPQGKDQTGLAYLPLVVPLLPRQGQDNRAIQLHSK